MTKKFSERNLTRLGIAGAVALALVMGIGLNAGWVQDKIFGTSYSAMFTEASGIKQGDPVRVGGHQVGTVGNVSLAGAHVKVEFTITNGNVGLGQDTSAKIGVVTILGDKALKLTPRGPGQLPTDEPIPAQRTNPAYTLPEVLNTLTPKAQKLDVNKVVQALETITRSTRGIGPKLGTALDGVTRLSKTINSRDDQLRSLFNQAKSVSGVLSQRAEQFQILLSDGNKLLQEAQRRSKTIDVLFQHVSAMSKQLTGLVADNREDLRPTLNRLNSVLEVLKNNKGNLRKIISGAATYATGLGEAVGSGPFFTGYIANLVPPGNLVPLANYLPKLQGKSEQGGN